MSQFEKDVESRDDFIYNNVINTSSSSNKPFEFSQTMEWIESLKKRIIEYSFVTVWSEIYTQQGKTFCVQKEDVFSGIQKLEWMSDFMNIDRFLLPFMILPTRQWKQETTLEFYLEIFAVNQECVQCSAYILEHGPQFLERFSVEQFHTMINTLLTVMVNQVNWDIYDLLHRTSMNLHHLPPTYRYSAEQQETLNNFAATHRYRAQVGQPQLLREAVRGATTFFDKNIYTDSQNVHATSISKSMIDNIQILFDQYHDEAQKISIITLIKEIKRQFYKYRLWKPNIEQALSRIRTDPSSFKINDHVRVMTREVLTYIYLYIVSSDNQYELFKRLAEELNEASGTCISGHVTRVINVLIGFHPKIMIKIDGIDQVMVAWQRLLQNYIEKDEQEEILMTDMTRMYSIHNQFVRWIRKHRKQFVKELVNENYELEVIHEGWNKLFPFFIDLTRNHKCCF